MNHTLAMRFTQPMTPENITDIMVELNRVGLTDHPLFPYIDDPVVAEKLKTLVVQWIYKATAITSQQGWDGMIAAQTTTEDLQNLLKNPALLLYSQTLLLAAIALLSDRKETE